MEIYVCECGCRQETKMMPYNDSKRGWIKGKHFRFIHGHNTRVAPPPNRVQALNIAAAACKGKPSKYTGSKAGHWKGGRFVLKNGVVMLHMPGHHLANNHGYVAQHRYVMERILGRALQFRENVHHINGIRGDNRAENLVALSVSEHTKIHRDGKLLGTPEIRHLAALKAWETKRKREK